MNENRTSSLDLGRSGERFAERWYRSHGYQVLARNWRCNRGELDLVAGRGADLVVCEVKTRTSERFGLPEEAVDWRKRRRIRALTAIWIEANQARPRSIRFDVVAVVGDEIRVHQGAWD